MSKIEFVKWYYQVGASMAEAVAEFYGVSRTQVELWLSSM